MLLTIIWYLLFGFGIGLMARALMPGTWRLTLELAATLGVVGCLAGGAVAWAFTGSPMLAFSRSTIVGSVLGTFAAMTLAGLVAHARRVPRTLTR